MPSIRVDLLRKSNLTCVRLYDVEPGTCDWDSALPYMNESTSSHVRLVSLSFCYFWDFGFFWNFEFFWNFNIFEIFEIFEFFEIFEIFENFEILKVLSEFVILIFSLILISLGFIMDCRCSIELGDGMVLLSMLVLCWTVSF